MFKSRSSTQFDSLWRNIEESRKPEYQISKIISIDRTNVLALDLLSSRSVIYRVNVVEPSGRTAVVDLQAGRLNNQAFQAFKACSSPSFPSSLPSPILPPAPYS